MKVGGFNNSQLQLSLISIFLLLCCIPNESSEPDSSNEISKRNAQSGQKSIPTDYYSLMTHEGKVIRIGDSVSSEVESSKNTSISNSDFGVEFGPIDGFESDEVTYGWNNQKRVLYISTQNPEYKLADGISIGSNISDVENRLGDPIQRTKEFLRYQTVEDEVLGILFYVFEEKVIRIVIFSYV